MASSIGRGAETTVSEYSTDASGLSGVTSCLYSSPVLLCCSVARVARYEVSRKRAIAFSQWCLADVLAREICYAFGGS
jgi:hypothetical protein